MLCSKSNFVSLCQTIDGQGGIARIHPKNGGFEIYKIPSELLIGRTTVDSVIFYFIYIKITEEFILKIIELSIIYTQINAEVKEHSKYGQALKIENF